MGDCYVYKLLIKTAAWWVFSFNKVLFFFFLSTYISERGSLYQHNSLRLSQWESILNALLKFNKSSVTPVCTVHVQLLHPTHPQPRGTRAPMAQRSLSLSTKRKKTVHRLQSIPPCCLNPASPFSAQPHNCEMRSGHSALSLAPGMENGVPTPACPAHSDVR